MVMVTQPSQKQQLKEEEGEEKDQEPQELEQEFLEMQKQGDQSKSSAAMGSDSDQIMTPLPAWARFYFYALHGLFDEIVFTALFDALFDASSNPLHLKGYSTIYSFFIYGTCCFFVEQLYLWSLKRELSCWHRLPIYLAIVYVWELCWGLTLRQFDLCSWDYSHYRFNFLGLITLEYAPGWLLLCLWQDVLFRYLFSLRIKVEFATGAHDKLS